LLLIISIGISPTTILETVSQRVEREWLRTEGKKHRFFGGDLANLLRSRSGALVGEPSGDLANLAERFPLCLNGLLKIGCKLIW
jgi:hypothetical protein